MQKYRNFFDSEADMVRLAKQYPDIAAFLGLFVGKKMYHAVASRRWSHSVSAAVGKKSREIRELALEIGSREDIDSIIDMTFIELVMKYDEKGKVRKELKKKGIEYDRLSKSQKRKYDNQIPAVGFEGYLINVFKWRLFKNIEAETKGIIPGIGWCKPYSIQASDDNHINHGEDEVNLAEALSAETEDLEDAFLSGIHIDADWIQGDTCSPPFDKLTTQERWILKMRFADRMGSREIADSVGVSPSVVRSRYNEIIKKLVEDLDPEMFDDAWNPEWSAKILRDYFPEETEMIERANERAERKSIMEANGERYRP